MVHKPSHVCAFATVLSFTFASASIVSADTVVAPAALEPAQLQAFASLVSDLESLVDLRLSAKPALVPLAKAAAEARLRRKHTGKVLTISGFTILGVGTGIGWSMLLSGARPVNCPQSGQGSHCDSGGSLSAIGLIVIAVSNAVGLALAIPGIVKMARESDLETEALETYRATSAPISSGALPAYPNSLPGIGFSVPVLSGAF